MDDRARPMGYHRSIVADYGDRDDWKGYFDLSYRSSFNDEPGEEDLPTHHVETLTVYVVTPIAR